MAQSLSQILIHIIFSTKNHEPLISESYESQLQAYIAGICNDLDCQALIVGGTSDHIHILCELSRTLTVADLAKKIKTRSTKWMKSQSGDFRNFSWQSGYGVFSIGKSGAPKLKQYIKDQRDHHKKYSFREEYLRFLRKYGIEFDEKYLWQ